MRRRYWQSTTRMSMFSLIFFLNAGLQAQTYSVGETYASLAHGDGDCSTTWYDPSVYKLPNGDLRVLAQGGNMQDPCAAGIDAFYGGTRNASNGAWTLPPQDPGASCNDFDGEYNRCGYSESNPGPIASPSVLELDGKYYMAFSGGNADYINGKLYWGVSTDGHTWDIYRYNPPNNEYWTPVIYGKYAPDCEELGIGHVQLAFENGLFYIFAQYYHKDPRDYTSVAYRFSYDPNHTYGFGSTVKQIYRKGQWESHSGALVWDYDGLGPSGTVLANGDHVLGKRDLMEQYEFGMGDVEFDQENSRWLHVYNWEGQTRWQIATSLSNSDWRGPTGALGSHGLVGDMPPDSSLAGPGLWYGTLSGVTRLWVWFPSGPGCGTNLFAGLKLTPAYLVSTP